MVKVNGVGVSQLSAYSTCSALLSGPIFAPQVTDLGKPSSYLIIAKSYVGDYSYELSQACVSAPVRTVHA